MNPGYGNFLIEQGKVLQSQIEAYEDRAKEDINEENTKILEDLAVKMAEVEFEAFGRFIVKGWRNLYDREGKEIPYTVDNAIKLMQMSELYRELYPLARQYATFLVSNLEATAKN
jgi:hypothetical protein